MKNFVKALLISVFLLPLITVVETTVDGAQAVAQEKAKPKRRKRNRVVSIRQKHIKKFQQAQEAFEVEDYVTARRIIDRIAGDEDLNNIEKAYIANYRGNICFSKDDLNCALREFKKIMSLEEGLPPTFYNQIMYVIAQVLFSQEDYQQALGYAQRWMKAQELPTADGYLLIGQAHYMLKDYDAALPNVQKGIQLYIDVGSVPKESWLNLLSSIYRQKSNYRKMLPVLKQLVLHYPKKTYLLTMGGVYNELDDPKRMAAIYQAMNDQGLLTAESEIVTLSSLLLSQDNPYKASTVIGKGLSDGTVKKVLKNYRIHAQSLYLAKEYEKALAPLSQAARLSKNGKLHNQLAQSYIALNRWKEAESALSTALKKKGLTNMGQTLISKGLVQFEQKKFKSAKASFKQAVKFKIVATSALNWIKYVESEEYRINELKKEIVISTDVDV